MAVVIPTGARVIDIDLDTLETNIFKNVPYNTNEMFYSTDIGMAFLKFTGLTQNYTGCTARLTLINFNDGSKVQRTFEMDTLTTFVYPMLETELAHAGRWIGQLTVIKGGTTISDNPFRFKIDGTILTTALISFDNINTFTSQLTTIYDGLNTFLDVVILDESGHTDAEGLRVVAEGLRVTADALRETKEGIRQSTFEANEITRDGIVNSLVTAETIAQKVAEKYQLIEAESASRLLSVEQQLAQKATYNADKFLYQSGKYNKSLQDLNEKTTKNNAVFIGDSLFGYDPLYYKNGGNTDQFTKFLGTSGISVLTGFVTIQDNHLSEIEWGFSGRSYKGVTGNLINHRTGSDKPYNDIDIYFGKYVGGGTFRYRTFNGAYSEWTTVDTNDVATNLGIININNIGVSATPTVYIEVLSGTVYIYGIKTYTLASTGIVPYFINEGGTKASQWAVNSTILKQFLQAIAPKQVHVWLGTNDSPTDNETTYIANLKTLLGHINLAISDTTDVIVYTTIPYSSNPTADANLVKYRDLILDNMSADDYSVFDLRKAWADQDASWYVDGVHPVVAYAKFNFGLISNLTTTREIYSYVVSDNVVTGPTGLRFKLDKTIGNVDDTKKITFKSDRLTMGYLEVDAPLKGVINLPNGGSFIESNTKREMISVRSLKMGLVINSTTLADEGTYREHVTKHVDIINGMPVTTTDSQGLKVGAFKDLVLYSCINTNLTIMPKAIGGMVYLPETDSANGGTIAFWDGTNWRSMHDKTIVG